MNLVKQTLRSVSVRSNVYVRMALAASVIRPTRYVAGRAMEHVPHFRERALWSRPFREARMAREWSERVAWGFLDGPKFVGGEDV